jgi:serine/tyrosine/threonine adenylyltransferase
MTLSRPTSNPATSDAAPRWSERFAGLGADFYTELKGSGLPDPHWVAVSDAASSALGWQPDWWRTLPDALAVFSGNALWPGMRPLASVYSGHQFGVWAGRLGDGRALLLGEVEAPCGLMELQLKGAGLTPYSRMGDGRAVLRSSIREFLCSEAMHHLGVPTTRALCITGSALPVRRERAETAAVVTRMAPSFIRFGHFEHFAHHGQPAALQQLVDFVIDHFYPACREAEQPALALLQAVAERTATLLAHWQAMGFCHGVMNTDNMSILGLTIDYGPFGFLDAFDPAHICNHSDDRGRYAFSNQPQVAWWNLHALAQALVPVVGAGRGDEADVEGIQAALAVYGPAFSAEMTRLMRAKLGLREARDGDAHLVDDLLRRLAADKVDYTIAMRRLGNFVSAPRAAGDVPASASADGAFKAPRNAALRDLFLDREAFDGWAVRYAQRLQAEDSLDAERRIRMNQANPKFVLRNHLAEHAIQRAEANDFSEVARLLKVLSHPFDEQPEHDADAGFPPDWAQHLEVSCSS